MYKSALFPGAVAALLAATASPLSAPAHAQGGGIQRCEAPDGTAIYTDKACAAFGASSTPLSNDLVRRISTGGEPGMAGAMRAPVPGSARRSAAAGCARSTTQLAMDLEGAWSLGDVNRIAESYHWAGLDSNRARAIMERLETLSHLPLWEAHFLDARIGGAAVMASAGGPADGAQAGVMQLVLGDGAGSRMQDLTVRHYQGCYFVQF